MSAKFEKLNLFLKSILFGLQMEDCQSVFLIQKDIWQEGKNASHNLLNIGYMKDQN
jgi:hypothetical protein